MIQSGFAHAQPELTNNEVPMARYRRRDLHQEAVSRGLLSREQATPTKEVLMQILASNSVMTDHAVQVAEQPKAVPLNEAHKVPEETIPLPKVVPEAVTKDNTLASKLLGLDSDSGNESNEEAFERISGLQFFEMKKVLREAPYNMEFDRSDKKEDIIAAFRVILDLD